MNITAIEPRKKGLSTLFIDGEPAFRLDTEILIAYRFDVGREIDDAQLKEVVDASDRKRCKDKAMWLLSYRDYARSELLTKLKKDFGEEAAQAALDRCEELGLINDTSFARRYSADLFHLKHLSKNGVRQKLIQKGIDRGLIDEVLCEFDVDEEEQIREIIEKKFARSLSDEKGRRRAISALQRMGYSFSAIKPVIREYTDTEEYYD